MPPSHPAFVTTLFLPFNLWYMSLSGWSGEGVVVSPLERRHAHFRRPNPAAKTKVERTVRSEWKSDVNIAGTPFR